MLKLLLEKRAKGEQLTEEELAILKEYDETISNNQAELQKQLEEEKQRLLKADSELQEKLKQIEELENSKKQLEDMVNKSESIEDVKIKIRQELEQKKKEEIERENKRVQEMLQNIKKDNEDKLKQLQEEIEKQREFNAKLHFKTLVNEEIVKRPYMETQLKKLLNDIDTTDLNQSKFLFNFLIESVNHEVEIEQYKKKLESGKNIFNLNIDDKDKEKLLKNKQDSEFEEFLKRNPNIK